MELWLRRRSLNSLGVLCYSMQLYCLSELAMNPTPRRGRCVVYTGIVDIAGRNWSSLVLLRRIAPYGTCMLGTLSVDAGPTCQLPGLLAPKNKSH